MLRSQEIKIEVWWSCNDKMSLSEFVIEVSCLAVLAIR